ncbi:prefoldin subunit [Candidatus Woesearchaeota archaeon]|nr:prefoldin subunit [Candidatus Woesearchaeota archaeon]
MADQDKIQQLQLIEHNMQSIMSQKQQFQSQIIEIDNALKEINSTEKAYKIVGNIMVLTSSEDLKKDLSQKKELSQLRVQAFEKQEKKLKEQAQKLQEEVLQSLKK